MIRRACFQDIDNIMQFIDAEWKSGHILAKNRDFFEYMYVVNGKVNFVVSVSEENEINGLLGFIPYDKEYKQISLSLWKALKSEDGMIGMRLLNYLEEEIKPTIIATPGVNPVTTTSIYRFFKYAVYKMQHFYRLSNRKEYNIASVGDCGLLKVENFEGSVTEINSFNEYLQLDIKYEKGSLKKEDWYVKRRYFEHPIYKYKCYIVKNQLNDILLVICREQMVENSKCIRVVDMLGRYSLLPCFTNYIDGEMEQSNYEYIDCYVAGVDNNLFVRAGWKSIEDSFDIIPNYFEPFLKENIDIYCSSKPADIIMFRGDGDQDRPN